MARFSQRIGIIPEQKQIQIDYIDDELKSRLWNVVYKIIIEDMMSRDTHFLGRFKDFAEQIYHNFYKKSVDSIPDYKSTFIKQLKVNFFSWEWYKIYDFIEFLLHIEKFIPDITEFIDACNNILREEFSGYQIVNDQIAPITNNIEINEVENAVKNSENFTSLRGANIHLNKALEMLSDKKNPDYRNSIKESISAVEAVAKVISNNSKDSLGAALDKIKGKIDLHPSLERGFKQIYGYTSDSSGIRHALMDNSSCYQEDALYILVCSSSFINYLVTKSQKSGITI